jgi:endonuclease YncB( thermonuclease family)
MVRLAHLLRTPLAGLLAGLALLLFACLAQGSELTAAEDPKPASAGERHVPEELFEVLRVVDGDTVHIRRKGEYEKIRLLSVDTEERMREGGGGKLQTVFGEECAVWAIRFFKDLADEDGKTRIGLRFPEDTEARDVYGRLLAHVILSDGRDFNLLLVQMGKSPYFNKYGNSLISHEAFVEAQREARKKELGIWNPATNEPKTEGAPAAKRDYDGLLPWWEARAQAIDGFRQRSAEHPEAVLSSEDADALEAAVKAKRKVEIFGAVDRTFEESNGDLTVLLRATDRDRALRVVIPRRLRKEVTKVIDFETVRDAFRQNYVYVRGTIKNGRRGAQIEIKSQEQWRLAGPEPTRAGAAEAGAPR